MSSLVRIPIALQVYRELRGRIMSGQLRAGSRLLPEGLAESMSISQTPVKEALVRLEADGLVEAPSRRGTVVRRFTAADIRDLYEARILIELNALRIAVREQRITPDFVEGLRRLLAEHVRETKRGTQEGLANALALDREFHGRLVGLGGNGFITDWHTKLMLQTHTVAVYTADAYAIQPTVREHDAVFAALEAADQSSVIALERHLIRSRDDMLMHSGKRLAEMEEAAPAED